VQWHPLQMHQQDWVAIVALFALWGIRLVWGGQP